MFYQIFFELKNQRVLFVFLNMTNKLKVIKQLFLYSNYNIIVYCYFQQMSLIFVGTAYHQVYGVPLNLKSPMMKLGEKKKSPVTSIYETFTHDSIGYSDPFDTFHINLM